MVLISPGASLPVDGLTVFHATDPFLSQSHIFAFYGVTSTSIANPSNTSRIQCHIFTPVGLRSYPRLAVSPSSPFYDAVKSLAREEQGDEICRGLAFTLLKYFSELPEPAKNVWSEDALSDTRPGAKAKLFSAEHAASLASRMQQLPNGPEVIQEVNAALAAQSLSYLDVDVSLPPGSITVQNKEDQDATVLQDDDVGFRYGKYASLMRLFGEPLFIPTSKVRRAPSKSTSVNHGSAFSAAQRTKVAREINELVQTEGRYVGKLRELAVDIADEFRAASPGNDNDASMCAGLFPASLAQILELNSGFLDEIEGLMSNHEEQSRDNQNSPMSMIESALDGADILNFTTCLLKWMPRFATPYTQYMQDHAGFGTCLKELTRTSSPTLANLASDIGERRLMSMLIEPVQRLPRYSLYADNIVKQLPVDHPAVRQLLAIKDIIANVCAQESASSDETRIRRLKDAVATWPTDLPNSPRLVCAVDATELNPPCLSASHNSTTDLIILLFTEYLVVLRGNNRKSYTSRTLLTELDEPLSSSHASHNLSCTDWWPLSSVNISEINEGRAVVLTLTQSFIKHSSRTGQDLTSTSTTRVFRLENNYEGKAVKFVCDFSQARIEGRYSEMIRENPKWEARSVDPSIGLGLVSAISERELSTVLQPRSNNAALQVVIDHAKHEEKLRHGYGAEIIANITSEGHGFYTIEIEAAHERATRDLVTTGELMPVLIKRITNLLQMRSQIRNPLVSAYIYQHNQAILHSLHVPKQHDEPVRELSNRSHSPVKALTSLFSSASSRDIAKKTSLQQSPVLGAGPILSASSFSPEIAQDHQRTEKHARTDSKITLLGSESSFSEPSPLSALEATFSSYVLTIRNRKGNVVGRVVARRNQASESEVNELYNVLLEDPNNHERAAQVSVDVLFAAFEKFLKRAWKKQMGLVVDRDVLEELEAISSMCITHNLMQHFTASIGRLAPQNQRALLTLVDLLEDLLSGMAHDGDKGMLTAAFAEIIVEDGDPRDVIPLLDQLISSKSASADARMLQRSSVASFATLSGRSTNNTSLTAKAASLRSKFGFGSLRKDTSRPDLSFTDSVRRTLSKGRSQQDASQRPPVARSSSDEKEQNSPSSQKTPQMDKIHDAAASSMALDPIAISPFVADLDPFRTPARSPKARPISASPITSPSLTSPTAKSPTKLPRPQSLFVAATTGSPKKPELDFGKSMTVRTKPSVANENKAPVFNPYATTRGSPMQHDKSDKSNKVIDLTLSPVMPTPETRPAKKSPSPGLRGVLCERSDKGNTPPQSPAPAKLATTASGSPTKKMRIKSPQKARSQPHLPVSATHDEAQFSSELRAITTSLCKVSQQSKSSTLATLAARLQALGTTLPVAINTSPTITETKDAALVAAKNCITLLEAQLTQADRENAALYDRTNKELMGVFEQVKAGNGVGELRRKLREEMDEGQRAREEVRRLRRETVLLRASGTSSTAERGDMWEQEKTTRVKVQNIEDDEEEDMGMRKENQPPPRSPAAARRLVQEKSMSIMGRGRPMRVDHV